MRISSFFPVIVLSGVLWQCSADQGGEKSSADTVEISREEAPSTREEAKDSGKGEVILKCSSGPGLSMEVEKVSSDYVVRFQENGKEKEEVLVVSSCEKRMLRVKDSPNLFFENYTFKNGDEYIIFRVENARQCVPVVQRAEISLNREGGLFFNIENCDGYKLHKSTEYVNVSASWNPSCADMGEEIISLDASGAPVKNEGELKLKWKQVVNFGDAMWFVMTDAAGKEYRFHRIETGNFDYDNNPFLEEDTSTEQVLRQFKIKEDAKEKWFKVKFETKTEWNDLSEENQDIMVITEISE